LVSQATQGIIKGLGEEEREGGEEGEEERKERKKGEEE